jgi:hypothetical protein
MSTALAHGIRIASITLLASLAGCSDASTPGVTDAGVDSASPTDVTRTDAGATDAPATTDTPSSSRDVQAVPNDIPAGQCGSISADVAAHVAAMSTGGWAALNRSHGMMMYGCAGAARPQDCLATVPVADDTNIGGNRSAIAAAHLRVLYSATTRSNFWTRSSADGRFVGRGIYVHDLSRDVEMRATGAMYDPAFFPDNSGFIYQPNGRMCPMSALTTGTPSAVAVTGAGSPCAGSAVGLYQHLAASLDGSDFWATSAGNAAWDDGGHTRTLTETARNERWTATAQTTLSLMANTGAGFTAIGNRSVTTPLQGDAVISPSSQLLVTRFVDEAGAYQGYVLHRLDATHTGSAIMASTREIARYCIQGAKPAFSFDERFITYHHYVGGGAHADEDATELGFTGSGDDGFSEYAAQGASNIYVLDLLTGVTRRVTTMGPGQYALYPHFRSDGWMYFIVRTLGTTNESVVASDAAFLMQ